MCGKIVDRTRGMRQSTCLSYKCKYDLRKQIDKNHYLIHSDKSKLKNELFNHIKNNEKDIKFLNSNSITNKFLYKVVLLKDDTIKKSYYCYSHKISSVKSYLLNQHKSKLKNINLIHIQRIFFDKLKNKTIINKIEI